VKKVWRLSEEGTTCEIMASRSRFVACALLLSLLTQVLARPEQLDGERNQAAETTESKVVEMQQESAAQFFPSASPFPFPSPSPTIQCGCEKPAYRIENSGFNPAQPIPGYYACSFLAIPGVPPYEGFCPIFPGDAPCRCPSGFSFYFYDNIFSNLLVCTRLSTSKGYVFPCDDDDFFPSPSASVPSVPSFLQEATPNLSDPVEELKTDDLHLNDILDLDLDTSGSSKSRDSRVQALTDKRLDNLMEALKD